MPCGSVKSQVDLIQTFLLRMSYIHVGKKFNADKENKGLTLFLGYYKIITIDTHQQDPPTTTTDNNLSADNVLPHH